MAEGKSIGLREMKEGQKGRILRIGADALRLSGVTLALRNREADYISVEVKA